MDHIDENELIEELKTKSKTKGKEDDFSKEDAAFVMDTASEALELLGVYNSDFTSDKDRDNVSSMCRIISEYLRFHAELLTEDLMEV